MSFVHPQLLYLLLVLPPAVGVFYWWSWRQRRRLLTRFIDARLLPGLLFGLSPARQKVRAAAIILAVACLILALARPQWGFAWDEVRRRGLDIVAAIDVSKSMLAEDVAPNRLARAKLAALDLVQLAKSDRLGLIAFAGSAFLQCPLTIDEAAFRQSVDALDVNIIPEGGTALAEAIDTALTAFKETENYKVLVLFTDGEDQDSGALAAAQKAAKAGLQIFTVGIGTGEGDLLRIRDKDGRSDFVRDEQGNVVKSHLNERLLQEIAGATEKGFYLPLRGAKTIETVYEQGLAPLPRTEGKERFVRHYHEQYHWPLAAALVLLLAEILIPERAAERRPGRTPFRQRSRAEAVAVVLLLAALTLPASGSPSSALRQYKAGDYDRALKEYERLLKRKGEDPRLHFNAGAAAYRKQQFEDAAGQFEQALRSRDLKLQELAYYNRGNARYYLGEGAEDPARRKEAWEKAVKDFQDALALNPQDADAKFNHDFVKRKLEELKQQPQQQQQDKQDKQQDQNQQQNQQDQNGNQKEQQQQQENAQQNQQAQSKDQEPQKQPQPDQRQNKQQPDEADQKQQQQAGKSDGKPEAQEEEQAVNFKPGQMSPEQARQLLDARKGEEKMLPIQPEGKPASARRLLRDW